MRIIDSVVYIHQGSNLNFTNNYAYDNYGGAIDLFFNEVNIQQQLYTCPIQFIGSTAEVSSLNDIDKLNVSISFKNNTVAIGNSYSLQSIYSNVFYLCSWYPDTLIKFSFNLNTPPENGTRPSVYLKIFTFYPSNTINDHICTPPYILCPCDDNNFYDAQNCLSRDVFNEMTVEKPIFAG